MRVQVNVSDELVEKIDNYAKTMGVSRSALCSVFIGQGVMGYDKSFQLVENLGLQLGESLMSAKATKETADKL